jgi:hypothetical protein
MVAQVKTNYRQELFIRETMKTPIQAEAWQRVYKTPNRASAKTLASRTLAKPHVKRRLNELRERQMKKSDITVDHVLDKHERAFKMAEEQKKPSEMIAAANAQAKLVGLLRDRVETGSVGDFGDANSIADVLELVAKEAGPEAAMTLAAMFGLEVPKTQATKAMEEAVLFIAASPSDAVN